jgi:hypothetical protein
MILIIIKVNIGAMEIPMLDRLGQGACRAVTNVWR